MPSRRQFMAAAALSPAAAAVSPTSAPSAATPDWPTGPGRRTPQQQPDRELRRILTEIDQRRIEATVRKLVSFGTRHTLSSQTDPVRGIGAARDWIFRELRSYPGKLSVELQTFVQPPSPRVPVATPITNVLATLRGSKDPSRIYVVSGHYDSRASDPLDAVSDAPGADDDASGVAAVMEIARVLATREVDATIIFAAVAGEEQGLYGSAHLASTLAGVQGMFTNDIVGAAPPEAANIVRLFAEGVPTSETPEQAAIRRSVGGENDSPSRQLARFVTDLAGTGMTVEVIYRRDRYLRGGDHIPFLEKGFPAARFTEPHEDYAHQHQNVRVENGVQYGDLPEFCDFKYMAGVARVNAATLWSLATAPGTPRNVRIRTNRLTNETDLVWDADPTAAGYEVVWRPTEAADWTHRIPLGPVNAHTVDLSKDNVFFGVRAIGANGRRSPAAFPVPAP
ncbi:M20/M25/M40 family metallo-hydrolase [Lentzea sp. NPDC006480]|uniref:M20/M25/M40 family metallo-hydrolase n=1 Tax=Lentzea sp. NPDC006480 TaxID=3157176 RepID=UPI0033B65CA4